MSRKHNSSDVTIKCPRPSGSIVVPVTTLWLVECRVPGMSDGCPITVVLRTAAIFRVYGFLRRVSEEGTLTASVGGVTIFESTEHECPALGVQLEQDRTPPERLRDQ
jgi:hypothetical protein